jgi:putative spermidine/putrescine transport system ATP-binding protein
VFNEGRVEQVGTPQEIYDRPATSFVAGFVGTSNLLDAAQSARLLGVAHPHTLRPERIRLANGGDIGGNERSATGTVDDVQYLGPISRVRITLPEGGRLVASVSSDEIAGVADGSTVRLAWPAEAALEVAPTGTTDDDPLAEVDVNQLEMIQPKIQSKS